MKKWYLAVIIAEIFLSSAVLPVVAAENLQLAETVGGLDKAFNETKSPTAEVKVILKVTVSVEGNPIDVQITQSSGFNMVDKKAMKLAKTRSYTRERVVTERKLVLLFGQRTDYDTPPKVVERLPIHYPAAARSVGLEGAVRVMVRISDTGEASEAQVVEGSGFEILDNAALETVKTWTFSPAMKNGQPVAAWYSMRTWFEMRDIGENFTPNPPDTNQSAENRSSK